MSIKNFFKKLGRFFTVEFASLSVLEIVLIMIIVGGGVFYIRMVFQKSYEDRLAEKVSGLEKCQQNFQGMSENYAYDKIRISDTTNVLLALQDYNFSKSDLPNSLDDLVKGKFLDGNLIDPELGAPYYYKKNSPVDYVLCVYLSTGVWGSSINQCLSKEDFLASIKEEKK